MSNIAGTIKSIRDIFRKDPGLSGDAQRIEQLGWMIFLKLFDDKDKEKEILNPKYKSPIPAELQWRNWAEDDEGITGDELINFVNNKLFPTLKNLTVSADDRLGITIRQIFDGTNNYMKSGTTFRQAINKLNEIDFNSSKEHHVFNVIYEEILQGLAAKKDTGEFYTPRAVTQFIVDMVNPKLGEKISDPACGTAGFLVCAIEHLRKQVKNISDRKTLQETITGTELKPNYKRRFFKPRIYLYPTSRPCGYNCRQSPIWWCGGRWYGNQFSFELPHQGKCRLVFDTVYPIAERWRTGRDCVARWQFNR
jgi:type I restriction enzyme M protein